MSEAAGAANSEATGVNTAPAAGEQMEHTGVNNPPAAGENPAAQASAPKQETEAERRARFDALTKEGGEFADIFKEVTQRAVKGRLAEAKKAMAAQRPVIDLLMTRYGVQDMEQLQEAINADASWWSAYAEGRGITEQQAREQLALQVELEGLRRRSAQEEGERRVQEQMEVWGKQSQEVLAAYPEFDLQAALQNEQFASMLKAGVNMRTAYEVANMEDIKRAVAERATKDAEARVIANIQANGARPVEGGASGQPGATVKVDPSKMTGKEISDIMARVARGEKITFS